MRAAPPNVLSAGLASRFNDRMTNMQPGEIVRLVSGTPIPLTDEKEAQAALSVAFDNAGIRHKREVRLSGADVVDFMAEGGIAIEVKLKAPKRAIYRQCERYCAHEQVKALVLVTATATGFPTEINGKPCWVASLGRGWL